MVIWCEYEFVMVKKNSKTQLNELLSKNDAVTTQSLPTFKWSHFGVEIIKLCFILGSVLELIWVSSVFFWSKSFLVSFWRTYCFNLLSSLWNELWNNKEIKNRSYLELWLLWTFCRTKKSRAKMNKFLIK